MNEEILNLNYKKPERFELLGLLGRKVKFIRSGKSNTTGTITRIYRSHWDKRERIKIEHDTTNVTVTTEYYNEEFKAEIMTGRLQIL